MARKRSKYAIQLGLFIVHAVKNAAEGASRLVLLSGLELAGSAECFDELHRALSQPMKKTAPSGTE